LTRIAGAVKIIIIGAARIHAMGHMFTCPCNWTLITQEGEEDLKMHVKIHMSDAHPGSAMSDEDIAKAIKTM
jgi:hypothetical protein